MQADEEAPPDAASVCLPHVNVQAHEIQVAAAEMSAQSRSGREASKRGQSLCPGFRSHQNASASEGCSTHTHRSPQ
jgi:hypothetical protein